MNKQNLGPDYTPPEDPVISNHSPVTYHITMPQQEPAKTDPTPVMPAPATPSPTTTSKVGWIAPLLLGGGLVGLAFAAPSIISAIKGKPTAPVAEKPVLPTTNPAVPSVVPTTPPTKFPRPNKYDLDFF